MSLEISPSAFAVIVCAIFGSAVCQYADRCTTPLGQNGSCVWVGLCQVYVRAFINVKLNGMNLQSAPSDVSQLHEGYKCELNDRLFKVCCPFGEGNDPDSVYREPPSPVDGHRNLGLLPESCGSTTFINRVYGGQKAGLIEFPWMALISTVEKNIQNFTCGGTIISERYILTAAHCITNLGAKVLTSVRVGEHDYSKERDCEKIFRTTYCNPPVQDFYIEKVISHPGYVGPNTEKIPQLDNDIGLLRLQGVIDFSRKNSQPVCLPVTRKLQEMRLDWETPMLPGWGLTDKNEDGSLLAKGSRPSTYLLKIQVPVVTNKRCGETYNRSVIGGVGFRQMCAGGERGQSSCNGDSGGPLLLHLSKSVQIGVISNGAVRCGWKNAPAICTRVAYYMDWILDQLEP